MHRGPELEKRITIKDREYIVHMFSPTRSLKLLARLTKIIGVPLTMMSQIRDAKTAGDVLPHAMKALIERMDEEGVVQLIKDMVTCVTVGSNEIAFDMEFHGRLGSLVKLIGKIVETQWVDFYEAVTEMMSDEDLAAAALTKDQKTMEAVG